MRRQTLACVTLLAGLLATDNRALANPELINKAIQRINACGAKFQDKPLRTCVADVFDQFLHVKSLPAREAVSGLRAAATRAEAVSVLQRAVSAINNLAAQSSGTVRFNLNGVNRAFKRALSVISSKG